MYSVEPDEAAQDELPFLGLHCSPCSHGEPPHMDLPCFQLFLAFKVNI